MLVGCQYQKAENKEWSFYYSFHILQNVRGHSKVALVKGALNEFNTRMSMSQSTCQEERYSACDNSCIMSSMALEEVFPSLK